MNPTTYGLDIAKLVSQMYSVEDGISKIVNRRRSRQPLIEFLGRTLMDRVALGVCGSAHWRARKIYGAGS